MVGIFQRARPQEAEMVVGAIAPAVISVLAPLAAKGAKALADTAGKVAAEKAEGILGALKSRWSGDAEASGTLKRFEESPQRYEPMLEDILKEKLATDKGLEAELRRLLEEMGASLEIVQRLGKVSGEAVGLEAGELTGSRDVKVDQSADEVSGKITGAKIDRIG